MVASSWFTAPLVAVALLFSLDAALAKKPTFRPPSLPTYDDDAACPERCSVSGPSTGNWSVYPNFEPIRKCTQTMFYDFSLYDSVDDPTVNHRIRACSSLVLISPSSPPPLPKLLTPPRARQDPVRPWMVEPGLWPGCPRSPVLGKATPRLHRSRTRRRRRGQAFHHIRPVWSSHHRSLYWPGSAEPGP